MRKFIQAIVLFSCRNVYKSLSEGISVFSFLRLGLKAILLSGLCIIFFFLTWIDVAKVYSLKEYKPALPSKLLDRKGRLISTFLRDNRIIISDDQIPLSLVQAFVAMEDNHFYEHIGFDVQAVFRAFLANLQSGSIRQGGSTITQQLAKVILTDRSRTYARKLKEVFMSVFIEVLFTKREILTLYFNQIYFGHGNYGVEAASRFYFNKTVSELSIGESAILASLPSSPNRYSPIKNPRLSIQKLTHVLIKMVDMGYLTIEEAIGSFEKTMLYYQNLNISPTITAYGMRKNQATYFTEYMRGILEKEFGQEALYKKGLVIHSSLDLEHQKIAEKALWKALEKQSQKSGKYIFNKHLRLAGGYSNVLDLLQLGFDVPAFRNQKTLDEYALWLTFHRDILEQAEVLNLGIGGEAKLDAFLHHSLKNNPFQNRYLSVQGAFLEADHKTGEVTVMIGGSPFHSTNQINRALYSKRQPGSTFKALVYAAALDSKKVTPASIFSDSPFVFLDQEGGSWVPENYSKGYRGFISLREALTHSANMVSIAVAKEVKLSTILPGIAHTLGVNPKSIPYNLSVTLGTAEVTPLQMLKAFALFPRGGKKLPVHYYNKVTDSQGKVLKEFKPDEDIQILGPATSTLMNSMLQDVVNRGTGAKVRSEGGYHGFAAGKTGTSQNFRDAWFAGYNKRYSSVIWIGYDRSVLSLGSGGAGGNVAAPIWGKYQKKLKRLYQDEADEKYSSDHLILAPVKHINVCKNTGKRENSSCFCSEIYEEIFALGTVPDDECEDILGGGSASNPIEANLPSDFIKGDKPSSQEDFFSGDEL